MHTSCHILCTATFMISKIYFHLITYMVGVTLGVTHGDEVNSLFSVKTFNPNG